MLIFIISQLNEHAEKRKIRKIKTQLRIITVIG